MKVMYVDFFFFFFGSTKESSILNLIMTVFHVIFFGFIIIAGFWIGSGENLVKPGGLAPFGVKGVLDGAAIVYFSYIGYDSVSTMAEEIKNPSKSLPIGIVGSVLIVSALYCLMALSLCVMVPYNQVSHIFKLCRNSFFFLLLLLLFMYIYREMLLRNQHVQRK